MAYNFQTGKSNVRFLTEYKSVTQNVSFRIAVLAALMSGRNMKSHLKMATVQEKAMLVLRFFETKSVIKSQSRYRTQYGRDPSSDNAIRRGLKQFQQIGSVLHRKGAGRPSTSQEVVERIQEAFSRSRISLDILHATNDTHVEVVQHSAVLILQVIKLSYRVSSYIFPV
jgi:hypothetical protein